MAGMFRTGVIGRWRPEAGSLGVLDALFLSQPGVLEARQRITHADARSEVRMKPGRFRATLMTSGAAAALSLILLRRRPGGLRYERGLAALRLFMRCGARYAAVRRGCSRPPGSSASCYGMTLALQTAEDVANTLGPMKGVLMKVGQMASYVDDGLSPAVRRTLARLQDSVPSDEPAARKSRGHVAVAAPACRRMTGRSCTRTQAAVSFREATTTISKQSAS